MPAGCEFICNNESCEHVRKGFSITAPWPLGRIELLINAPNIKNKKLFRDNLINLKNDGRKHACIIYPNEANVKTEGFRVSYWSPEAKCVWQYDVLVINREDLEEAIRNDSNIPDSCPKTGCKLLSFNEITEEGIPCPHCGEKMLQSRWFTNEI